MAPRRLALWFATIVAPLSASLLNCVGDTPITQVDAGADVAVDTATGDVATDSPPTPDGGTDAVAPRCDKNKPFGTPVKLSLNALDVVVDSFGSMQVDPSETHAYFQKGNLVRQYDLSGTTLTHNSAIADVTVDRGFTVSPNGLEMIANRSSGPVRFTRGNTTSNWLGGTAINIAFEVPDGAVYVQFYNPSFVGNGPRFDIGRFIFYAGPSTWDIMQSDLDDAGTFVPVAQNLHAPNVPYINHPVPVDDTAMYFARWGVPNIVGPHLARATRANAQAPWGTPSDVPLGSLVTTKDDSLLPYAVTPDDCALYFGYSASPDGAYSLDGPFVLYVARRPQ